MTPNSRLQFSTGPAQPTANPYTKSPQHKRSETHLATRRGFGVAILTLLAGCAQTTNPLVHPPAATKASLAPITATTLMRHITALTAPEMRGRAFGSDGGKLARQYVTRQLQIAGASSLGAWEQPFGTEKSDGANVVGIIGGTENGAIVLGAHFDHLGERDGDVFHGAEDNASGVAVVLEVARVLVARRSELKRSIVVALFDGEEAGMLGSRAFVAKPPIARDRIKVMVNVDMIGRPTIDQEALALPKTALGIQDDASVGLVGTKDRPELRKIVDQACAAEKLEAIAVEDLPAPIASVVEKYAQNRGDNASFEAVGIPAIFLGSGESDDYHKPTDTKEKLDAPLMTRRARMIVRLLLALSQG